MNVLRIFTTLLASAALVWVIDLGPARGAEAPKGTASRPVDVAYRSALSQPNVRAASIAEIRAQLRTTPPIAFVNGYWVVPIDLGRVYANTAVRPALLQLGATTMTNQFGLIFVPNELADTLQLPRADLFQMLGVDALRIKATGLTGPGHPGMFSVMSIIKGIGEAFNWLAGWWQNYQNEKQQRETKKNCQDKSPTGDCDNDGVPNGEDKCPYDPDCKTRKSGFVGCVVITCQTFTTRFGEQLDKVIQQVTQDIRAASQTGNVVTLGPTTADPAVVNVAFPPVR
jgi:hypothetical protein